jgi:hypothetical protein
MSFLAKPSWYSLGYKTGYFTATACMLMPFLLHDAYVYVKICFICVMPSSFLQKEAVRSSPIIPSDPAAQNTRFPPMLHFLDILPEKPQWQKCTVLLIGVASCAA